MDGILMNTALAEAQDPVAMARCHAARGGRRPPGIPGGPHAAAGGRRAVIARARHARVGDVGPVIAPRVDASPQGPQMTASKGLAPRRAALNVLTQVRSGRPLDAALDGALKKLDDDDRRLAHEMAAGVLRRQQALDARLAPLVTRAWSKVPSRLQDVLRLGAYQLVVLDRVPAHAAVDTSVSLAREEGGPRAGGFVNAVLRRLGAQPEAMAAAADGAAGLLDAEALARRHSHPLWLVERWLGRFGPEETSRLLEWNDRAAAPHPPARAAKRRRPGATLEIGRHRGRARGVRSRAGDGPASPGGVAGICRWRVPRAGPGAGAARLVCRPARRRDGLRRALRLPAGRR